MDARDAVIDAARKYLDARDRMREARFSGVHDDFEHRAYQDVKRFEAEMTSALAALAALDTR